MIKWEKGEQKKSAPKCDGRNAQEGVNHFNCGPNFLLSSESSRLPTNHRQHIQANGSLVIGNLQKSDSGTYICSELKGERGSSKRRRVTLQVIG